MKKGPDDVFFVKLRNGELVKVSWYKNYFSNTDHLELRGSMTSTGYRSDFIIKKEGEVLDRDAIVEYARQLAQQCWEKNTEKHGSQPSLL